MPALAVTGDASQRGSHHGEALRDSIAECLAIYDGMFKLAEDEVVTRAAHFEQVSRAWHPDLADEIDAIADAANQPRHWLWALNARSELMSYTGTQASECTSVWSPDTRILAQNWDWVRDLEPLTVVLDATHEDGHHVVTVTEPGMVGKVGMSSAGTAIGLNFLFSPEPLDGVPVHLMLRALLDARSRDEVESLITSAGTGRSAHVFMANAEGVGSSIEYTGSRMWRTDSSTEPLLHTNHFVNGGDLNASMPPSAGAPDSEARYTRSAQLVTEQGVGTEALVLQVLDDRGNEDFPICRKWVPSTTLIGKDVGTVCAISMRLADSEMDVRLGPDPSGSWQTHSI